ncbi:helix-turn-helix domain-containing protein [Micromonospora sp. MS34]|uniref:helix-turn-helix domain-containing protein n=1 Tax=Micromonospora sp. MS34 TaxID=3385971 RepID=UPI0039A322B5
MRLADLGTTAQWEIAVPDASPIAGVAMAGFTGRAGDLVDLRVIPYPAMTLFIDFGDALVVDDHSGRRVRGAGVVGLAPAQIRALARNFECLQVRLSPTVARALLGTSWELTGSVVGLEEVWGRDAVRLQEQLYEQRSWADRFAITQAALSQRVDRGHAVDPEVARSWERILTARGRVRVERLAAEVEWSRKRLWCRFRSQIAITPKRAAQLIRFDHAAHRLAAGQPAAAVAADSGYADQSHLHRDTTALTGLTPSALAVAQWLSVDDVAWGRRMHADRADKDAPWAV